MKKIGKGLIIIVVLAGILYISYLVFVKPAGFTSEKAVIDSYFSNITSETVCEDHFNAETEPYCTSFTNLIDERTIEVVSVTKNGEVFDVVVTIDGTEFDFEATFVKIDVTGVKSVFNKTYYLIDIII